MWQIQSIPTPQIWQQRIISDPPVEALSNQAGPASVNWAHVWTDGGDHGEALGTLAGEPAAAWNTIFTFGEGGPEAIGTLAGEPEADWAAQVTDQEASDAAASLAGEYSTNHAFVWNVQSDNETLSIISGPPEVANG